MNFSSSSCKVYLKSGLIFNAVYEEEAFDRIISIWESRQGMVLFVNI